MSKNLIIYFRPYKYRNNDEKRFELYNYSKSSDIKCVEIFDYLFGNKKKLFKNSKKFKKKIYSFDNIADISFFLKEVTKKYKKIFILNFIPLDNFRCSKVIKLIYSFKQEKKFFIFELDNSGFPNKLVDINVISKLTSYISVKNLFDKTIKYLVSIFSEKFYPDFFLVAGNSKKKNYLDNNLKIKEFNTWDNSNLKLNLLNNKKEKHIVYVDGAGPYTVSDREFLGRKHYLTIDIWYRDLNYFFNKLEKKFKCDVIIANHPNTELKKKKPKHFYGRKTISGETLTLIQNSKFMITRQSTAFSHALYLNKPIILIYSNENKKDLYDMSIINKISNMTGAQKININEDLNFKKFESKLKINNVLYKSYLNSYISCRKDNFCNSTILQKIIDS